VNVTKWSHKHLDQILPARWKGEAKERRSKISSMFSRVSVTIDGLWFSNWIY
jgi:hypothetical protein